MRFVWIVPLAAMLSSCNSQSPDQNPAAANEDVQSLIASDDPKACASPEAIKTALSAAAQQYGEALANGMPAIRTDTVSATGVNKDIHEITCSATGHAKSAFSDDEQSFAIVYKLRPALDQGGGFVAEIEASPLVKQMIEAHLLWWNRQSSPKQEETAQAETEAPASDDAPTAAVPAGSSFGAYSTQPASGTFVIPTLQGEDADWAYYKTRITQAARQGANFAGNYRLDYFGCGTGCVIPYIIDGSSGHIIDMPVGGEDTPYLTFKFQRDSKLLKITWGPSFGDDATCDYAEYVFDQGQLTKLSGGQVPGVCTLDEGA